jgi:alpha-beta hydrolase superfamily lysophospholipase
MKRVGVFSPLAVLIFTVNAFGQVAGSAATASAPQAQQSQRPPAPRVVDLKASDGTILKATYFAAARPGPGLLLFHQSNRTRKAWDEVAAKLSAAGINTLTVDSRGHGERPRRRQRVDARAD